jgi:GH15 family glucan-1,4-alpha-glucosidase
LIRSDLLAGPQEFGHFVKFPGSPAVDASLLGLYYSGLAEKQPGWKPALDLKIQTCMEWIEAHADSKQYLPEQVAEHLNRPSYYSTWVDRWGEIASPLLWSHANYIILHSRQLQ